MKKVNQYKLLNNHDYYTDIDGKKQLVHLETVTDSRNIWLPIVGRITKKIAHYTYNGNHYKVDAKNKFYTK